MALDPSSTCTGWAVWMSDGRVECGRLTPWRSHTPPWERIDQIVDRLSDLLAAMRPVDVIIEIPSGRPGKGAARGATGQLAIYGAAVGAVREATRQCGTRLNCVDERQWTQGRPQATRRRVAIALYPDLAGRLVDDDPGSDSADALMLGTWWMQQQRLGLD